MRVIVKSAGQIVFDSDADKVSVIPEYRFGNEIDSLRVTMPQSRELVIEDPQG